MALKEFAKRIKLFSLSEQIVVALHVLVEQLSERLNKTTTQNYIIFREAQRTGCKVKKDRDSVLVTANVNGRSFLVRLKRDSSDALVFKQLILENEYRYIIKTFQNNNLTCNTMIDAGANVGLAFIYLKCFYPDLKIYALEPAEDTYSRLIRNIALNDLTDVVPCRMGLWRENTLLQVDRDFRDKKDWSFRLIEGFNTRLNTVTAINVVTVLNEMQWPYVDLLKIDIEGGEAALFANPNVVREWLTRVKILALEIHDEVACREDIHSILRQNDFLIEEFHGLTVAINRATL